MASLPAIAFAPFFLKNEDFLCLCLTHDPAGDLSIFDQRSADFHFVITADEQNVAQSNAVSHLTGKLFDSHEIPFSHAVLLSARTNYSVSHHIFLKGILLEEKTAKVNLSNDYHRPKRKIKRPLANYLDRSYVAW
jgi:hypothetical protein